MSINKAIALRISELLHKNDITQYELSKRSTLEQSTISHILDESTKFIKIQTLFKIADAFGLTIIEFFDDKIFKNIEIY